MKNARWIILGLTVVLTAVVYINWKYMGEGDYVIASSEYDDGEYIKTLGEAVYVSAETTYFDNARYTRSKNRDDAITVLNQLIENGEADANTKKLAAETIAEYALTTERETSIESLIKSKGYDECVVFLSNGNATVVVETLGLETHEAIQIMDIVSSITGFNADVINIIEFSSVQN